jgi:hypothetical protein
MSEDNMFYVNPKETRSSQGRGKKKRETVSYEDLYYRWLHPKLLATPPIRAFPKPLVDFAEFVLEYPDESMDWRGTASEFNLRSLLGHSLRMTAETEEFSAVAMDFVGYKYELGFGTLEPIPADEVCWDLIRYLELEPDYFKVVRGREGLMIKGMKKFRQESGLKVWLEYPDM